MTRRTPTAREGVGSTTPPPSRSGFAGSFAYCRRLSRLSRSSFRFAFDLLPASKADAMHALYAFLRLTDDLADEPGDPVAKRARLHDWRRQMNDALAGVYSHRIHAALHHTFVAFGIPIKYLYDAVRGGERDLSGEPFRTFDELKLYCHQVASVVGLACVRIWGVKPGVAWEQVEPLAEAAGYAFQLTNILRDLKEDRDRGRVYLPADELARFDCPPEKWGDPASTARFRELLKFQVARARDYYQQSEPLAGLLTQEGRVIFTLMSRAYRGLLDRVEAVGEGVLSRRVRLRWWRKAELAGRVWAHKCTG